MIQNPSLPMGFVNQAVSMEMANDIEDTEGYTRLQKPFDGYEKLQKAQNSVGETQDYPEYMIPQDQSDVYEEVSDTIRNRPSNDNPYDRQVAVADYTD